MKRLALISLIIFSWNTTFCQAALLDAIASKLIPGVVTGISTVVSSIKSNKKSKIDTAEADKHITTLQTTYNNLLKDISTSVEPTKQNISAINVLFGVTSSIYSDISDLEVLSDDQFLKAATTANQDLNREICRLFIVHYDFLMTKKDQLIAPLTAQVDQDVADKIRKYKSDMDENLSYLQSTIKFTKSPNYLDTEANSAFLKNLNSQDARNYISKLKDITKDINDLLNSRILGFVSSIDKLNVAINAATK